MNSAPQISIRTIHQNDLTALARSYAESYTAARVGEHWSPKKAVELLTYFYTKQRDLFFVALDRDVPVGGCVGIVKPWWDGNHISDGEVFVDPGHQKQGIATELLSAFIRHAMNRYAIVSIDWITFRNKQFPLTWYQRLGFAEIKDWVIISGKPATILSRIKRKN